VTDNDGKRRDGDAREIDLSAALRQA